MRQLLRDLVFFSIAVWLVPGGTLAAQSRNELRKKYGEPVSETFIVRPGISVTATFGTNGQITEFLISPDMTGARRTRLNSLSKDSVTVIIDELVPPAVRGKHVISTFINDDCPPANDCYGTSEKYERATVYYNSTATIDRVHYAVVDLRK